MAERFQELCRFQLQDKTIVDPASSTDHLKPNGKHKSKPKKKETGDPNASWNNQQDHASDLLPVAEKQPVVKEKEEVEYWWQK